MLPAECRLDGLLASDQSAVLGLYFQSVIDERQRGLEIAGPLPILGQGVVVSRDRLEPLTAPGIARIQGQDLLIGLERVVPFGCGQARCHELLLRLTQ